VIRELNAAESFELDEEKRMNGPLTSGTWRTLMTLTRVLRWRAQGGLIRLAPKVQEQVSASSFEET
jgi:hypothetical protein